MQLPESCAHCNKSAQGVRLWWYIGRGDWLCGYCGYLHNPKYPMRTHRDYYEDTTKQELIDYVKALKPENNIAHGRWFDRPRKDAEQRQVSNKAAQKKWRDNNPDKVKQWRRKSGELLKGMGTGRVNK